MPIPAPSGLIVLSGDVESETTALTAAVPGLDMLMTSGGSYILATPSDNASIPTTTTRASGSWPCPVPWPA